MSDSVFSAGMRKVVLMVVMLSLFTVGCRTRYLITLNNGNRITAVGKPKFDNGYYRFRDINGQTNYVSGTRVRSIEWQPRGFTTEEASPSKH